jgi:hypothetical protein
MKTPSRACGGCDEYGAGAQVLLRGPLIAAATKEFRIDGSWDEPQVTALPRRRATTPADTSSNPTEPASSGEKP